MFSALVLAAPAQADRGDKWRDRRGGEQHRNHDPGPQGSGPHGDRPNGRWRDRDDDGWSNNGPWFGRREHDRAREGVIRGRMMPLEELENRISRRARGFRIGNPELLMFGGRPVYRIRWRTPDGHILIVFADAESGEVLDIRGR